MTTRDRLAEALQVADARDRRLDGYKLDVIHRYADALLPVVDAIAAERAAEELRAARTPMLELADQIEAGAFSLDAERRGFLASAVRACAGGRRGEPCR